MTPARRHDAPARRQAAALALQAALHPHELLLWQGASEPRRPLDPAWRAARNGALVLGAALPALAFLLRDEAGGPQGALMLPAVAALLLGAGSLVGSGRVGAYLTGHDGYAVTDRRVLMLRRGKDGARIDEYGPAMIAFVTVFDLDDGVADVVFREGPGLRGIPWTGRHLRGVRNPVGLRGIRDPQGAAEALRALRDDAWLATPATAWDASRAARTARDRRT